MQRVINIKGANDMNRKLIIYGIEAVLMMICCTIGFFEDAFIAEAFAIAFTYNVVITILYRRLTGDRFYKFIANMILEWAITLFLLGLLYGVWLLLYGYTDYGLFGMGEGVHYSGIDALLNNIAFIVICIPSMIINGIYVATYCIVHSKKRKKQNR